ncbi:MAG: hypothetical protein J5U17_10360 [Candidatus Methanoperedens sp.]|nr:hypothetical protein [Candidatus Methanoperedens sp.]MCE8428520.1 hypothetical protein [Candidatus Methanoperedens sp.]
MATKGLSRFHSNRHISTMATMTGAPAGEESSGQIGFAAHAERQKDSCSFFCHWILSSIIHSLSLSSFSFRNGAPSADGG